MPRLSSQQREQAIGRLNAGQRTQVIANAFNCSVRTIERLLIRYNTTNSTNDRPRSGRRRVTTPRQDRFILRQHLQDRFITVAQTARQTIGNHQRPICDDTDRNRLASQNVLSPSTQGSSAHSSSSSATSCVGHPTTTLAASAVDDPRVLR
ncbi:uncharacterized protein [Haliotis cracherodii]|uniref:uncharacterized protein n=1 Tax=Haliotis cracherodii TaxID=6455 RepID=UPI0039E802A1